MEVMIPEFHINPILLGKLAGNKIKVNTQIIPEHPDEVERTDGYWQAYIIKSKKSTRIRVNTLIYNNKNVSYI